MAYPEDATGIMLDVKLTDAERLEKLLPLVYEQLHAAAAHALAAERSGHTLQATALVHEAYIKLVGERDVHWQGRGHFYAAAAEAMRRILIDHARARGRLKRGGEDRRVPLSMADVAESWDLQETLTLDEAMRRLGECCPAIGDVVRLRFFAGLSIEATAEALSISPSTVKRHWNFGRTWLFRELKRGDSHE